MRLRPTVIVLLAAAATAACSAPTAEDLVAEVIATRNNFEVRLASWVDRDADGPAPWLYLDVEVVKNTEKTLASLTVFVQQLGADGNVLSEQRVPIDVAGMDVRGLSKKFGLDVRPMHPDVDGISLIIEPNPAAETWAEFPELDRVRPRGR